MPYLEGLLDAQEGVLNYSIMRFDANMCLCTYSSYWGGCFPNNETT